MSKTRSMVMAVLMCGACSKPPPSPAQLALTSFVEAINHGRPLDSALASGAAVSQSREGGEPVEGTVELVRDNVGTLDWLRTTLVKETELPNADHRIDVLVDICSRGDNSRGGCMRPNVYSYRALMRNEDGAWKVAAATMAPSSMVR